jgi:hypothetical protein
MIENPFPTTWQNLQFQVNRILNEIGLESEVGKTILTPRGKVEIDVFAIDKKSVDKITYVIECKNWASAIPQTVVHAFTTVMHECGGNIGYIVSKEGLQSGALEYTKFTNIQGLTFQEFQEKYFEIWFDNYFAPQIFQRADALIQYTEPINSRRTRFIDKLSDTEFKEYQKLRDKNAIFGILMCMISAPAVFQKDKKKIPDSIEEFKAKISNSGSEIDLKSIYFRELLSELLEHIEYLTEKFNEIFNENIFAQPDV